MERSRAAQILLLLKAVSTAQQEYKLATGDYAPNFKELDMEVPGFTLYGYHEPDRILWSEDVMIAIEPQGDGTFLVRGLPRRGCQNGNSIALGNNQCYVFDITIETGEIVCHDGTKTPLKTRCREIGY